MAVIYLANVIGNNFSIVYSVKFFFILLFGLDIIYQLLICLILNEVPNMICIWIIYKKIPPLHFINIKCFWRKKYKFAFLHVTYIYIYTIRVGPSYGRDENLKSI